MKYVAENYLLDGYVREHGYVIDGYVTKEYVYYPKDVNVLPTIINTELIGLYFNVINPTIAIGCSIIYSDFATLSIDVKLPNVTIGNSVIKVLSTPSILFDVKSPIIYIQSNDYVLYGYVIDGYVTNKIEPATTRISVTAHDISIKIRQYFYPNTINISVNVQKPNILLTVSTIFVSKISISVLPKSATFFKLVAVHIAENETPSIGSVVIRPGTLWIKILSYYESPHQNVYIKTKKQNIAMALYSPHVNMVINTKTIHIGIKINSSMAQMDERRLVVKIDNVELDYPMYFDDTEEITHTATKTKAVDDSTVVSILPLGKYSKSVTISGYTFDFDAIRSISFDKEVELVFKDNSTEMARFDLLNNPLSIDEVANNYYDVKMKVLI